MLLAVKAGQALIGLPNQMVRDWLENRLTRQLERVLTSYLGGQKVKVQFVDRPVAGGEG